MAAMHLWERLFGQEDLMSRSTWMCESDEPRRLSHGLLQRRLKKRYQYRCQLFALVFLQEMTRIADLYVLEISRPGYLLLKRVLATSRNRIAIAKRR